MKKTQPVQASAGFHQHVGSVAGSAHRNQGTVAQRCFFFFFFSYQMLWNCLKLLGGIT